MLSGMNSINSPLHLDYVDGKIIASNREREIYLIDPDLSAS